MLVGHAEAPKLHQCRLRIFAGVEIEGIEAAACQQENVIALDGATGTQLALIAQLLAQHLRLRETAPVAVLLEMHHDQREAREAGREQPDIVGRPDHDAAPCRERGAGGDLCSLANARSIPIADAVQKRFDDLDYLYDIGDISLNISGCMNSCGHHHVANIGILGIDKHNEEWYQITLGGSASGQVALGEVIGPSVAKARVAATLARILEVYVERRESGEETFLQAVRRLGVEPFKERVYAPDTAAA